MKRKYKEYPVEAIRADTVFQRIGNYIPTVILHHGSCCAPSKGEPEYEGSSERKVIKLEETQGGHDNPFKKKIDEFKYLTLLICRKELTEIIETRLQEADKVTVLIEVAFEKEKFQLSNNTFLAWHNCKFDKLSSYIKKIK